MRRIGRLIGIVLSVFLLWSARIAAQTAAPIILGQNITLLPPVVDAAGRTALFGSAVAPDGANLGIVDLYIAATDGSGLRRLTRLPGDLGERRGANAVSLSANGARAAFTMVGPSTQPPPTAGAVEEVHILDLVSGADRVVSVDTGSCIRPLTLCIGCFFPCVNTPHLTADGAKVLYSVSRDRPFFTVNADGSGLTNLPVFSGFLAPAPQRVISRSGLVVFISSAPFGPTFAPAPPDIYVMNLDGGNIQNVTKFETSNLLYTSRATISADGSLIAFESTRDTVIRSSALTTQISVVRPDGSGLRTLTSGPEAATQPSLSSDGSLIAFIRNGQIHTMRSDGSGVRALTNFQMSAAREPVISEDGSLILFAVGPRDGGIGALYSIRSDGTNLRPVYAPRALNQNGVAGLNFGVSPSPGSLFSAYGLNFTADSIAVASGFPLPPTLAGLSLLVNGIPAPLLAVTPWQVNAQLPASVNPGPVAFQLRFTNGPSPPAVAADVKAIAPAIFILPAPGSAAPAQAAAFHAQSGIPADREHPAVAGEVLEIYGTGLGMTVPFVPAGTPAPASPPARTLATPQVLIGNLPAQVVFSGLTPGLAGVYQVNVVVPGGLRAGPQAVFFRFDPMTTSNSGAIYVQ